MIDKAVPQGVSGQLDQAQVDWLRLMPDGWDGAPPVGATGVLRAIDQLRRDLSGYHGQLKAHDDLQRHCDNQRKRIVELEGLYAKAKLEKYEADSAYLTEYDRAEYLTRQKAKLREQVVQSFDKTSELETENAKLRELARDMWQDLLVHGYKVQNVMHARYDRRMRELGIEVDA